MKNIITLGLIVSAITLSGCTDADKAYEVLHKNGYTKINTGSYDWFACSEKDTFSTKFSAISPSGTKVTGTVCSGFFKGNTIRFD